MELPRLWILPKPLFSPQQSALLKGGTKGTCVYPKKNCIFVAGYNYKN